MADNRVPLLAVLAAGVGVLLMSGGRRRGSGASGSAGAGTGTGSTNPIWPLAYNNPKVATSGGLAVGASRPNNRHHAGVDIPVKEGAIAVATESGVIVATNAWAGSNAKSLLLETDSGIVVNYGAVGPGSWKEFGVAKGTRVVAGQPIARVGRYPGGDTMLHFELYTSGTTRNAQWKHGKAPPDNLLNPTSYLQRASQRVIS